MPDLPTTSRAWTIPSTATTGTLSDLTLKTIPVPTPGPKQVLVRIQAAALNYRDILVATRSPYMPGDLKEDLVPGSDGAGVVVAAGEGSIWQGKEGAKVVLHPNPWLSGDVSNFEFASVVGAGGLDGTLREYAVVGDERVIGAEGLSAEDAASLFTAGATAWHAIRTALDGSLAGALTPWSGAWTSKRLHGQYALTLGTGGVSCFAIQILHALGATVISTSSSDAKLRIAKSIGAAHTINYSQTPDWHEEVLRLTGGRGVDHVIEVAGAGTLLKSLKATRQGGLVSVVGVLTQAESLEAEVLSQVLFGAKIVRGILGWNRDMAKEFVAFVNANEIKPVIAEAFAFGEVPRAMEVLAKSNSVGKLVVRIGDA